ncbi:MAG: hypothetical protein HQL21_05900 [Candidatus Omnitrophica bacterium]|nr:hypothetical protein [Candidatus Omnitrophota bacterium]
MEPISLTTLGVIALSMAAGAMLSNLFKKKSCSGDMSESVDENKEKDINDLISGKK